MNKTRWKGNYKKYEQTFDQQSSSKLSIINQNFYKPD